MKSQRTAKRAPLCIYTHANWIFLWFPGSRASLELDYDIDAKQFAWKTARQSKDPESAQKDPKIAKRP
jgi:hypothetical protein